MIYAILFIHFVADFVLQTDAMSRGKSTSNRWLITHIAVYSLPFLMFGPLYSIVNSATHLVIDYVTSRMTSTLWKKGEVHNFFVVIGFDQFLHVAILVATMPLIWKWWLM